MPDHRVPAIALAALLAAGLPGCLAYPAKDGGPELLEDPALLHARHDRRSSYFEGRYFNPWHDTAPGLGRALRYALTKNPFDEGRIPALDVVRNDGGELARPATPPRITWIGHASLAIHDGSDVVLTDPNFASRILTTRRRTPPGIPIEAVPADAMAVISHSHLDHLDEGSVERLPSSMHWFVPMGLADWFRDRGRANVVELDWWQSARHGRWTITCLPIQHWSWRLEHGTNGTLWCSWLLDSGSTRYFFAGDSGYFHGFREFARELAPIDVALMPIGAYEPRWFMRGHHMNPADSYRAFRDLGAAYMIPMHWSTFDLSFEPMDLPPEELRSAIREANGDPGRVKILKIGESWTVPPLDAR